MLSDDGNERPESSVSDSLAIPASNSHTYVAPLMDTVQRRIMKLERAVTAVAASRVRVAASYEASLKELRAQFQEFLPFFAFFESFFILFFDLNQCVYMMSRNEKVRVCWKL